MVRVRRLSDGYMHAIDPCSFVADKYHAESILTHMIAAVTFVVRARSRFFVHGGYAGNSC